MVSQRNRPTLTAAVLAGLILAGCGGGDDRPPAAPAKSPRHEAFPPVGGRSLMELVSDLPEGPVLSPSVTVLDRGRNRIAFALLDTAHEEVGAEQVALYVEPPGSAGARGPYAVRIESLAVRAPFRSRTASEDEDAPRSIYVAQVELAKRGAHRIVALARLDGRLVATSLVEISVGARHPGPPKVGERAVRVSTPTVEDVGGDIDQIDTRVPPDPRLHAVDLADVLGRRPAVVVFATPALCRSRVCGPVVDVAAQVQAEHGTRAAFIHMEIYRQNRVEAGYRRQVGAWRLPTEPWTFVIDRRGRIAARFEGAFSVGELTRAVQRVVGD